LDDVNADVSKGWKSIRVYKRASTTESLRYYELKQHKPWFDKGFSKLFGERSQAKLQWFQNPSLNKSR